MVSDQSWFFLFHLPGNFIDEKRTGNRMRQFPTRLGEWIIFHRWWIIISGLLISIFAGCGLQFLTFNSDLRVFFSKENPQLQALEELENTYTKSDNVAFVLEPKDGNVFTRETLEAVEKLTERAWQTPYSLRVDSLTNYQYTWTEAENLFVEDLVKDARSLSDLKLTEKRNTALTEPLLVNRFISPTGHVTGVSVTVLLPGKSITEVSQVAAFARKLAADLEKEYPNIRIYLSGGVMFDNAFGEVTHNDLITLLPASALILIIIISLSLRSLLGTLVALLIIIMSLMTGLGLAGWLGFSLNPASSAAPPIILTVAVADSIHILATILQRMGRGHSKPEAILESFRLNFQAVFLTSITTVIGFVAMNFSDAPPFRDLGTIAAMGITAAFGYSVLLLPAVMAIVPLSGRTKAETNELALDWLATFVIRHRRPIFWITLCASILLAIGAFRIELNDEWVKYFDKRYDIRIASDFTTENLSGMDLIEYSLESGTSGGVNSPTYLAKVDEFADWYREQPKVVHVVTICETIKHLNQVMNDNDEAYYRIPDRRDLIAQYLLLYELSLPYGLDLNNQINIDKSASRMSVILKDPSTREVLELEKRAQNWLSTHARDKLHTSASGLSLIWAYISKRNIQSMLGASFGALILISFILIFALRSLKFGLLSLIPNLGPAFMAFGLWGLTIGQIGLASSVIVSLTLGIIVDDTVHFLTKYLYARRGERKDSPGAVRYAFHTVGTPLWVTSVALTGGFLFLTFSGFRLTADLGLITAFTIIFALLLDFLLLPSLLIMADRRTGTP